ncbi:RHS repeat-associated core domain-containing protein, partial [Luteimonas huabeiensis]|uniref:RHS repeat-associated core domain-containing protein n=1 Tax=Luteimonas huabeiensis TaxID=1244513 RepID=UPI001F25FDA8
LVYMQQRYYDPMLGVFLSVDPVTAYEQPIGQFHRYRYANNNPYRFIDPDGRQACGSSPDCIEAKNYNASKAGTQTVVQSQNIDAAAVINLPSYESTGNVENAVRFDESFSGSVTTTPLSVTSAVNGGVIESTISGTAGADAIGHSHPVGTSDPSPGPRDDIAVNANFPNNIVNNGNVVVVEKVSGQFRVRVLNDANLSPKDRTEIQRDVNRFQKRAQSP